MESESQLHSFGPKHYNPEPVSSVTTVLTGPIFEFQFRSVSVDRGDYNSVVMDGKSSINVNITD